MADYRDIGSFYGSSAPNVAVDTTRRTLVFLATHDGGGNLLPYRNRSFISFTFGGRRIEDFNLIATINGDSLSRKASADFEDITATSDVLDGQYYFSTHFKNNSLNLRLVSDAIDLRELEDFKNWFAGGKTRELILAEHPNRAIMARVGNPPEIDMLPFEKPITLTMGGLQYETSTTVYRGFIDLEFVMDEPFWYAKTNILGNVVNGKFVDLWEGLNLFSGTDAAKEKLKDAVKIVYEDGIPLSTMLSADLMLFGNDIMAASGNSVISRIAEVIDYTTYNLHSSENGYYHYDESTATLPSPFSDLGSSYYYMGAAIEPNTPTYDKGVIAGPNITKIDNSHTISIPVNESLYFYYAGTAPAYPKLVFTVPIIFSTNSGVSYISTFNNTYLSGTNNKKSYIEIRGREEPYTLLLFTTPNFITSYNKAAYLIGHVSSGTKRETVISDLRDNIRHARIREWAIAAVNGLGDATDTFTVGTNSNLTTVLAALKAHLKTNSLSSTLTVSLDSKTGEALGTYTLLNSTSAFTENIGDMMLSNFLVLKDRNYFSKINNLVNKRTIAEPENSYLIVNKLKPNNSLIDSSTNDNLTMTKFSITYENLYY